MLTRLAEEVSFAADIHSEMQTEGLRSQHCQAPGVHIPPPDSSVHAIGFRKHHLNVCIGDFPPSIFIYVNATQSPY